MTIRYVSNWRVRCAKRSRPRPQRAGAAYRILSVKSWSPTPPSGLSSAPALRQEAALMGRHEKIIQAEPPAPRAPAVLEQRDAIERELADLKLQIAETALAAYEGLSDGRERLASLDAQIRACAFQLDCNGLAHALASRLDHEAVAAWKTAIYAMPPEKLIEGITAKDCYRLCRAPNGKA